LHVGYGTFEPVRVDDVDEHSVSSEHFEISESAAEKSTNARARGGRVVVVGTTTMRASSLRRQRTVASSLAKALRV
jgi:S-adenosylmethionine:tRNA ribosyltransferase-isomerase